MILHWHPEMDMIVDAAEHRKRERDERRADALDELAARRESRGFLADAALISHLAEPGGPVRLREAAPGRWVPDDAGTHLLTPQYEHGEVREWTLDPVSKPHAVSWPGGGPWPSGCGKHALLAPDCRDCGSEYVTGGRTGAIPDPPPPAADPETEIRAVLAEPLGLDAGQLTAQLPDWPEGTCKECHLPRTGTDPLCSYCRSLAGLKAAVPAPAPERHPRRRPPAGSVLLGAAGWACFLLAAKLADTWLLVAALTLWVLMAVKMFREAR